MLSIYDKDNGVGLPVRKFKYGDHIYDDNTPLTLFPSVPPHLNKVNRDVPIDIENYCDDWEVTQFDECEREFTAHLRENAKRLGRILPMSKGIQQPMRSYYTGPHCLLPLKEDGNESGLAWTTYTDPLGLKLQEDLANTIMRNARNADEEDAARLQLVNYSANVPFASMIRHDGAMKFEGWNPATFAIFADETGRYYAEAFIKAGEHLENFCPNMNVTKALGFNSHLPDGTPINKSDYAWSMNGGSILLPNNLVRYNFAPIKLEYLLSGKVGANIDYFLDNCASYGKDWRVQLKAFEMEACSIHTEAYRTNNADVPKVEFVNGRFATKTIHSKDRVVSKELEGFRFGNGHVDNLRYRTELTNKFGYPERALLKKRPMFPSPSASFSVAFILLFRCMLKEMEDGPGGFLSAHKPVMERYKKVLSAFGTENTLFIQFDRSTCEQFITDNWESYLQMWPDWMRDVTDGLGCAWLPSLFGYRFVRGGLPSGTASTTAANQHLGAFEMCNLVYAVLTGSNRVTDLQLFQRIVKLHLAMIHGKFDYYEIDGFRFSAPLGTDDQLLIVNKKDWDKERLRRHLKDVTSKFMDERSLGGEVCEEFTMFGIHGNLNEFKIAESLVLKKFCLMEHVKNGDAAALKMDSHFEMLDHFYDPICKVFADNKLGNPSSYKKGAQRHLKLLAEAGYPVEEYLNMYNPSAAIIMGNYFEKNHIQTTKPALYAEVKRLYEENFQKQMSDFIDPRQFTGNYPVELMRPLYEKFLNYFMKFDSFKRAKENLDE
jgi:hypothetical protein